MAVLFLICAVQPATNARANDLWIRDKLTCDWGGLRTDMAEHVILLDLRRVQFYQGVSGDAANINCEYGMKVALWWIMAPVHHTLSKP
jgi:hypothetical protein